MVLINKAINEITCKLVYYGPGLCGKTTNLEKIYENPKMSNKGKMISMSTETDRTLFFDFMPMELGTIGGQKIRVQLYTVPGQVFYDATRKLVLRGADGVVFVADSQSSMKESNIESLENLRTNLLLNRIDPDKIPIVYQLNKRDLPNISTADDMRDYLDVDLAPVIEASAINGEGVTQTLRAAVALMLDNVRENVDLTLYDEAELRRPDLSVRSGVTASSAGTPKVGMHTPAGVTSVNLPPPPRFEPEPGPEPLSFTPATPFEVEEPVHDEEVPFGEVEPPDLPAVELSPFDTDAAATPVEADPFATEAPATPAESDLFESQAAELRAEADPFETEAPLATTDDDLFDTQAPPGLDADPAPFHGAAESLASAVAGVASDHDGLREALAGARSLVRQLEAALEAARGHERAIAEKLGE